jgi:isochorismate synthase
VVLDRRTDDVERLAQRAGELLAFIEQTRDAEPASTDSTAPTAELECRESTSEAEWHDLIDSIRGGIRSGEYSKVVAARRSTLRLSPAPEPARVLSRLDQLAARCTRFSLRIGARTFVGATPERLVRRAGRRVSTEAIAGSISAAVVGAAERLTESHKDLAEHRYVVDAIASVLEPLASTLSVGATPEVRKLRHILHLRTPIEAELASDVHILELVSRLHPTPAVGGVPTEPALDWITSRESAERGWYASPFGWVDERGDGEMVVALRSALIHGDRVHLYAGAGIVDESDPALEYEETEVKMAGMRLALGLDGASTSSP